MTNERPPARDPRGNGWEDYRLLVLDKLAALFEAQKALDAKLDAIEARVRANEMRVAVAVGVILAAQFGLAMWGAVR